jgi:hypothetical protein
VYCVRLLYDLNKSPPDTNVKLKNQRTKNVQKLNKERQADVGFFSSQTQMIKNIFTVAPMLVKLLGSMAHNVQGLLLCWNQSLSSPEPLPKIITDDEGKNKKPNSKCPARTKDDSS